MPDDWHDALVLAELDQVPWDRLEHAYGAADDVPDQLRALRSADEHECEVALRQLFGNIFHQGTRYEATAYAVPFLLEVLAEPDTAHRDGILHLLSAIAVGYDETWLPDSLPIAEHRRAADGGEALLAAKPEDDEDYEYLESLSEEEQGRFYAYVTVAAYDAVRAGLPLIRTLLSEPDLAPLAAALLGWFPEEDSLPALEAAAESESAELAATALVSIGLLGGRAKDSALRDPRPLVRWGAAIALAKVDGPQASEAVLHELLAWVSGEHEGGDVPFLDGDLAGYASLALRQLGDAHADTVFDALLGRIPAVSGTEAMPVVSEALRMAFESKLPADTPFAALSERQQRLVRALASSPATWRINDMDFGNFSLLVGSYGLPRDHKAMAAYASDAS